MYCFKININKRKFVEELIKTLSEWQKLFYKKKIISSVNCNRNTLLDTNNRTYS